MSEFDLEDKVYTNYHWLLVAGFILICLGLMLLNNDILPFSVILSQIILVVSSIFLFIHAFRFWWDRWVGFLLHIMAGVIYCSMALLLSYKIFLFEFTFLLAISYAIMGFFRIIVGSDEYREQRAWSWTLISGIVNVTLCIYLIYEESLDGILNASAIDLVVTGFALFMLGREVK